MDTFNYCIVTNVQVQNGRRNTTEDMKMDKKNICKNQATDLVSAVQNRTFSSDFGNNLTLIVSVRTQNKVLTRLKVAE